MRFCLLSIFCIIIFLVSRSYCTESDTTVTEIQKKYESGDVSGAEYLALKALNRRNNYQTGELAEIHKYLALCYIARGERLSAVDEFVKMLELNPQFRFRRQVTSPKIMTIFEEAMREFQNILDSNLEKPTAETDTKWRSAAVRSIIFPGLGQFYKGDKVKGYIFSGSGIVSVSGLVYSQIKYSDAHDDYLRAVEVDDINEKYDKFNSYYKIRNATAVISAAVYLYNIYDCVNSSPSKSGKKLSIDFNENRISFTYSF